MENGSSSTSQPTGKQDNALINKVKGLVVRAWRERWSDIQWGIHLKRAIQATPPGTDTRQLSEMLLKQAIVGVHPNTLILSYLKHATFSKLSDKITGDYGMPIEEYRRLYREEVAMLWREVELFRDTCRQEIKKEKATLKKHRIKFEKSTDASSINRTD